MYKFHAIRGSFGALDTFLIMIPPNEIAEVVGHDPRGMYNKKEFHLPPKTLALYEDVQRAVLKDKVDDIEEYTEKYSQPTTTAYGALPALSVGLKTPPKFKRFDNIETDETEIGTLTLLHGAKDNALYLDGLKRACAILNLSDRQKHGQVSVAVMLFSPKEGKTLTDSDLGQLFYDFNAKSTPIPRNIAVSRDTRDPHIQLANYVSACSVIVDNGGVDRKGKSIGMKSKELFVLRDIVAFARAAADDTWAVEHLKDRVKDSNLTDKTLPDFEKNVVLFLDGLVSGMTPTVFKDRVNNVHLLAPVWTTFGVTFHDLYVKLGIQGAELAEYGTKIGKLDWNRFAKRLEGLMMTKSTKKGDLRIPKQGGSPLRRDLTKQLRDELGIAAKVYAWTHRDEMPTAAAAE